MGKFLSQYEILFKKAKTDLYAANVLFHLQQSAEKFMKAVLSKHKISYPKIHDLVSLFKLITDNHINFILNEDLLIELNDYAVEGRYSLIHEEIENIQLYFDLLDKIVLTTDELISD